MNHIIRQDESEIHLEQLINNFDIFFENLPEDYKPNQAMLERTLSNMGAIFSPDIIIFAIEDYDNKKMTILDRQGCINIRTLVDFYLDGFKLSRFVNMTELNGKGFSDMEFRYQRRLKEKRITIIKVDSRLTNEELEIVKEVYNQ